MQLINIPNSSNIAAIGFRVGQQICVGRKEANVMRIVFTSGMTYDYYEVPKEVWDNFVKAESKGKFYHSDIKDKYLFEKVGD